ncbi:MAG: VWA domain-containing protein [Deltaproteobacteria bacterium]|nr:VWA domain-containing protein [Deltaproteobacteria bacterium]
MKTKRIFLRLFAMVLATASLAFVWSCIERPMKVADPQPDIISDFSAIQASTRDVDILFMIDTSRSMEEEQITLLNNFPALMRVLKDISGGLPNVHIGVISPDIGTYTYNINGCEGVGDDGKLLKGDGSCSNPVGQNFIVDVEPAGCTIAKVDDSNTCTSHTCGQTNCEQSAFTIEGVAKEPAGLQFVEDEFGCPRCRNYTGEDLEDVFTCMADIGIGGCGFEQPLEAIYKALTPGKNPGFIRDDAYLAMFLITDEDDCSAKEPGSIFDDSDISITGNLGPLTSFRCTEFGIVCDQTWQRVITGGVMNYTNCVSRSSTDARNMLNPISKYTGFLSTIKSSEMIIAGAIAGPYNQGNLSVGVDSYQYPELQFVCYPAGSTESGAVPGIRLYEFVKTFIQSEDDLAWAYTSVCNPDYSQALEGLGNKIKALVEVQCITTPLKGCPDPAAANGFDPITDLSTAEAEICEASCDVRDISTSNNEMVITNINPCPTDYAGGHPEKRDPSLTVEQCWHVMYNEKCADPYNDYGPSRGAEIIISRRTNPTPGTSTSITCAGTPLVEMLCQDGLDNDFDGKTDCEDDDCNNPDNTICSKK